jgi:hypothetical protein
MMCYGFLHRFIRCMRYVLAEYNESAGDSFLFSFALFMTLQSVQYPNLPF